MVKVNNYNPKFKSSKIEKMVNNRYSEDEAAIDKQIDDYGFPDFSFDNSSKIKINNWLTKSQELYNSDENDIYSTSASSFGQIKKFAKDFTRNSNLTNEVEYETQSITIEFLDETSSMSSVELIINDQVSKTKAIRDEPFLKNEVSKNRNFGSSLLNANGAFSTPLDSPKQNMAPPPPPPPPLSPGLLKFKRTKTDFEKNDLDTELKNRISHLKKLSEDNCKPLN